MGMSIDDDNIYSSYNNFKTETYENHYSYSGSYRMNWIVGVLVIVGVVVLLVLLCRCCCGSKKRGRVLAPPTNNSTAQPPAPAAYPQQQYAAPYLAAVPGGAGAGAGPYYGAPYPTQHVMPLHAPPILAPPGTVPAVAYPQQHYFYAEAVSPYPPAVAPYPPAAHYPHPQPHQPNAPADSCPPSYDLVMAGFESKQPAYNPNVPH